MSSGTVVFILSSDRSGSTWVGYVLGSTPECRFVGEFWRAWNEDYRQPCSWCYGNGVKDCSVLAGIEQCTPAEAYELVLLRSQARFLVDSSKRIEWAERVITGNIRLTPYLLHLIRDPRGWYASESRRMPNHRTGMISHWLNENVAIRNFVLRAGIPATTAFYEDLAKNPETEFRRLCSDIGCIYEPGALRYWETIHHAFAANGASSPILRHLPDTAGSKYFLTGDDDYYETKDRNLLVDERWREQLPEADERAFREDSRVAAFLALYGRVLTLNGID